MTLKRDMPRYQAKDVPEALVLAALALRAGHVGVYQPDVACPPWAWQDEIVGMAPELAAFPSKVLLRKLGSMARRGVIHGCDCGCRGDWHTPIDDGTYDRCPCGCTYNRKVTG